MRDDDGAALFGYLLDDFANRLLVAGRWVLLQRGIRWEKRTPHIRHRLVASLDGGLLQIVDRFRGQCRSARRGARQPSGGTFIRHMTDSCSALYWDLCVYTAVGTHAAD